MRSKIIWRGGDRNTGFILGKALPVAADRWREMDMPPKPRSNQTHEAAKMIVELWLEAKGRKILTENHVFFGKAFVEEHKMNKRYQGHSYDIWTDKEIIEIDDLGRHSKTSQKINDGVATLYATNHLSEWKFYRLLKEEIVDRRGVLQPTAAKYLKEHLF